MAGVLLREAVLDDRAEVDALRARNGLEPERTPDAWTWLWRSNPDAPAGISPGWVLERDRRIVGFIGSVPRSYHFRGRSWTAAAARALVVDERSRGESLRLVAAFVSNGRASVLVNTSANANAAAVFRVAGARALEQPAYDEVLYWAVSSGALASSWLRRRGAGDDAARLAGGLAGPLADLAMGISGRVPGASGEGVRACAPADVGEPFDRLWQDLCGAWPDRFLARRDSAALRWHWGTPQAAHRAAVVLTCESEGVLTGYAVVTREDSPRLGLKRARIVDLIAREDDPATLRTLMAAAYRHARGQKVHVLELLGFPAAVRSVAATLRPLTRRLEHWPFWYRAQDPILERALVGGAPWYASPFEGDATL